MLRSGLSCLCSVSWPCAGGDATGVLDLLLCRVPMDWSLSLSWDAPPLALPSGELSLLLSDIGAFEV